MQNRWMPTTPTSHVINAQPRYIIETSWAHKTTIPGPEPQAPWPRDHGSAIKTTNVDAYYTWSRRNQTNADATVGHWHGTVQTHLLCKKLADANRYRTYLIVVIVAPHMQPPPTHWPKQLDFHEMNAQNRSGYRWQRGGGVKPVKSFSLDPRVNVADEPIRRTERDGPQEQCKPVCRKRRVKEEKRAL